MIVSGWKHDEDGSFSAAVRVPAESSWFDGHFPGLPVLPGIAQLGMIYELIRRSGNGPVRVTEVNRVRFKQMIVPDDDLSLFAEPRPEEGRYNFRITRGEDVVCTGNMTLARIQPSLPQMD